MEEFHRIQVADLQVTAIRKTYRSRRYGNLLVVDKDICAPSSPPELRTPTPIR
jgi:hypothetical protein